MLKQLLIIVSILSFAGGYVFAQDNPDAEKKEEHKHMEMNHEKDKHDHMMKKEMDGHSMNNDSKMMDEEESIVREGVIDLEAIDENEDGMVFQDQMCWNVISDKAGECPQCGMTLKEVSLEKAKENLEKHDYKVK